MNPVQHARRLYLEGRLHDALEAAQVACEQRPKDADAWWLLGCVSRHAGMPNTSDDAFRRAAQLSSSRRIPPRVDSGRFSQLLDEARARLPEEARARLAATIVVEPLPDEEVVESGVRPDACSHRVHEPENVLTVYQVNIENRARDEEALPDLLVEILREA
jgi:hypothetical protein